MKKLFKFIFSLIFIIILLIGLPIGILYFMVADGTDDAPTSLYADSVVLDQEVADLFNRALADNQSYDFTFSEDELNVLIFAIIRDALNKDYYKAGCDTDACKNVQVIEIDDDIPVVGGRKVTLKHIYAEMKDDELSFYAPLNVMGIKTRLKLGLSVSEKDGVYTVKISKMGLGKINLASGLGKSIRGPLFSAMGFTAAEINDKLAEKNLPITFSDDDFSFTFAKSDLGAIISGLLIPDEDKPENKIIRELFSLLTAPEEGGLSFGFYEDPEIRFGMRIDLEPFAGDEEVFDAKLAAISAPFDIDSFIQNKTQTFLLANLTGGEMKVVFTDNEFNRLLYDKTNGYADFQYAMDFGGGSATFALAVKGIAIEILSPTQIKFNFLVEINGMKSIMVMTGRIESNATEDEITIYLDETLTIGTVQTASTFLFDIIGDNVGGFELMEYRPQDKAFVMTAEAFDAFMGIPGGETPLGVERMRFTTGELEVFVTVDDSALQSTIANATDMLNDLLEGEFLDPDAFTGQEETVVELSEVLENISQVLTDPEEELTEEHIDALIDIINQLDEDNQQILYGQIEDALTDNADLFDLYNSLFGK